MRTFIIVLVIIVVVVGGGYFLVNNFSNKIEVVNNPPLNTETASSTVSENNASTTEVLINKAETVIGQSVQGNDIVAYHYGQGETELLFIGGIHGGYEWNTVLVASQLMDYLKRNPSVVPANLKVTVIPVLNPDGLAKVVGTTTRDFSSRDVSASKETQVAGRFNANKVDLNRNFDCDWKSVGTWQSQSVSGGSAVFSEPESQAIRSYVAVNKPAAVIAWYSAAGGVYASSCHNGVSTETKTLTQKYADASGYPAYQSFDFYATTGDMLNWLAKENIPAISVLLTNHTDTEWTKNQAGVEAMLKYYAK